MMTQPRILTAHPLIRCCLIVAAGWLATGLRLPAQDVPDDLLTRLQANVKTIDTLETGFVQEKQMAVLQQTLTIRGRIYMAKPDRLAWHVVDPIRYSMIMDGQSIRQWDAESKRESRVSLDANPALQMAAAQMRQWFTGDYLNLKSEYAISLESETPVRLRFVPLPDNPAAGYIERVRLEFTEDERYLAAMTIEEKQGDRTTLRFTDTRLNQPIPDAAWNARADIADE